MTHTKDDDERYPTVTPHWAVGMTKLGPGLYIDKENALHVSPKEICESLGSPPTLANMRIAERAAAHAIALAFPEVKTIEYTEK